MQEGISDTLTLYSYEKTSAYKPPPPATSYRPNQTPVQIMSRYALPPGYKTPLACSEMYLIFLRHFEASKSG